MSGRAREESEPRNERSRAREILGSVWDWTRSVLVALALFLVLRAFVVEAFKIPTSSMEGTLLVGDFLLVNKLVYGAEVPGTEVRLPAIEEPKRSDVVVFNPPHEPLKNYVKRIVGVAGDTLEMKDRVLYRNGGPVREPYVRYVDESGGDAVHPGMGWQFRYVVNRRGRRYRPTRDNWGPLVVPVEKYFVLGDNRDNSEDSRYWGFVDRESIRGRPWVVYYSFDPNGADSSQWLSGVRWDRIGGRIR
jgi:signal peptidase I